MIKVVQQARIRPHVLTLPPLGSAVKYRPLTEKILTAAGVAPDAPAMERFLAVGGWVAYHAVHPDDVLHPNGHAGSLDVLPPGETWAAFNAEFDNGTTIARDNGYWYGLYPNGFAMLEALVGTVALDGTVADDGMLEEYEENRWRIRNFASFRAVQCTLQCKIAQVLLAAQGGHSVDLTTTHHDPMAVFDPGEGRWIYFDPSMGEMQKRNREYLSPLDLVTISLTGDADEIESEALPFCEDIPLGTYFSGGDAVTGMRFMTVHTSPQWSGGLSARVPYRFGSLPYQGGGDDISGSADQILPELGCGFTGVAIAGAAVEVRLATNWPNHVGYERSLNLGETWAACAAIDYLTPGAGEVRYRSVDALGWSGKEAVVSV